MKLLPDLFLTFARIGAFTFGGGYAMIAMMEDICVEQKRWFTHEEMMDLAVIAESTPGPIGINCATSVGFRQAGLKGALAATFGMVLPSFTVIYLISMFLDHFLEIEVIAHAFQGIKVAVGILILNAAVNMIRKMQKKPLPIGILLCSFCAMMTINLLALHFSSIFLILIAGVFSLLVFMLYELPRQKGRDGK